MSGPSRREEQDRRSQQPVKRFSRPFTLRGLFNKLTGLLGIRALFNFFARPRGPRPVPIKIDPAWFPVPQTIASPMDDEYLPPGLVPAKPHLPPWEPPWGAAFEPPWMPPWEQAFAAQPNIAEPPGEYWESDDLDDYLYLEDDLYECDPGAFAEDNPDWDETLPDPEPEDDDIYVRPGEKVPLDAGELLRTYYVVGEGDVHVYARIHPDDMDLHPDQIIEPNELRHSFNLHFRPKGPKPPE